MLRTLLDYLAHAAFLLSGGAFLAFLAYGFMIPEREEKNLTPQALWCALTD